MKYNKSCLVILDARAARGEQNVIKVNGAMASQFWVTLDNELFQEVETIEIRYLRKDCISKWLDESKFPYSLAKLTLCKSHELSDS